MNIYFFCEVNENKEPKFYEQFQNRKAALDKEALFVVSSEYAKDADGCDNVTVLPDEVMNEIEKNLQNSENRGALLSICRVPSLEEFLSGLISEKNDCFMFANGIYSSFVYLEEQGKMTNYVKCSQVVEGAKQIEFYKNYVETLNGKMKDQQDHINFAQECLQVRELQLLESETRKAELEEILRNNDVEEFRKRIDKLENEAKTYYDLYMNSMKEVNSLKEEKLSLQKAIGKKA